MLSHARAVGVSLDAALTAAQVSSVFSKMHIYSRTVRVQASEGAKFLCGRQIARNFGELDQNVPCTFSFPFARLSGARISSTLSQAARKCLEGCTTIK